MRLISKQGEGALPVEKWEPENCGKMDMVIRKDGSWWHEGAPIRRQALVKLFSRVLRKDVNGKTYLVTPVEKIEIEVECAHFQAISLDLLHKNGVQYLFFTTNVGDIVRLDEQHELIVLTDKNTQEPTPLINVRGRLQALLSRPVFYELVDLCETRSTNNGKQIGVESAGQFFPIAPANILEQDV